MFLYQQVQTSTNQYKTSKKTKNQVPYKVIEQYNNNYLWEMLSHNKIKSH